MDWVLGLLVFLCFLTTFCHPQNVSFACNFEPDATTGCSLQLTSGFGNNLAFYSGDSPGAADPMRPLSDVTSVQSPTTPSHELCRFPYNHTLGSWPMYFCWSHSSTNYTCPTTSGGIGQCLIGKYAGIRAAGTSPFNQTYSTTDLQNSNNTHCLDFYYYIPNRQYNAKIRVGWQTNAGAEHVVEVKAMTENRWQRRQKSFTVPSSSTYKIAFTLMRDVQMFTYIFGLDEIKIHDNFCNETEPEELDSTTTLTSQNFNITPVGMTTERTMITGSISSSQTIPGITGTNVPTSKPSPAHFRCDFSSVVCFQDSPLLVTDGQQFIYSSIENPPEAPLSDVSSITQPTSNNELCKLPYEYPDATNENETSYQMWFCYKNQCPTSTQKLSNCTSGYYGLISLHPWESKQTITESIAKHILMRNSLEKYCLRYYYYFTVYDKTDWGQQILVLIQSRVPNSEGIEIDRLTFSNMTENRWHFRNVTFNIDTSNYNLIFTFEVNGANQIEDSSMNKTIYFALDNIELSANTKYCENDVGTLDSSATTTAKPGNTNRLSFILGIGLGSFVSIFVLVVLIVFKCQNKITCRRKHDKNRDDISLN